MNQNQAQLLLAMRSNRRINHIKLINYRTIITCFDFSSFDGKIVFGRGYKKWIAGSPYRPIQRDVNGDVCFDIEDVIRWQA
jgi:hypothetical protein